MSKDNDIRQLSKWRKKHCNISFIKLKLQTNYRQTKIKQTKENKQTDDIPPKIKDSLFLRMSGFPLVPTSENNYKPTALFNSYS